MQKIQSLYYLLFVALVWSHQTNGFAPVSTAPTTHQPTRTAYFSGPFLGARLEAFVLEASAGKKKMTRRRVRKQAPGATAEDPVKQAQEVIEGVQKVGEMTEKDRMLIEEVAKFEFSPPKAKVAASSSSSSNSGKSQFTVSSASHSMYVFTIQNRHGASTNSLCLYSLIDVRGFRRKEKGPLVRPYRGAEKA
jgi:hypothetical protein